MKRYIYCMAIFAMMLYSCNKASEMKVLDDQFPSDQTTTANAKDEEESKKQLTADTIASAKGNFNTSTPDNNPDWDKKIIKTANLQLQSDDYKKFNLSIHNVLKKYGAYIAAEKEQETDYKIENTLTIKVPVAQFDDLVNSIGGNGIKIMEKNISTEDVTGEAVDTKARMQAKMAVRDKYIQLLKQAKNMNEILQVQTEINEIQEGIEAANGRINYLQHASAYSTINLYYYQYINSSGAENKTPDFLTKLTSAFSTGTTFLSNLVLFIISIWPLLLGAVAFWIFIKKFKLKKA
jgi:hypothetical protein